MLVFMPKLFDSSRCKSIANAVVNEYNNKKLSYEGNNTTYYGNSYGASIHECNALMDDLTEIVKQRTGMCNIKKQHSFSRIYLNNSILKKHVDRETLDLTLSVCIYDDTGVEWPLFVENLDGSVTPVLTVPGDGALILGTKMNHWRDLLVCDENKMVIQTFFHWSIEA